MTWNSIRVILRWLSTFKVSLAPEGKICDVVKDWVGEGLRCEQLSASFMKDKKIQIKLVPWCYIYNLVGFVLHYLNNFKSTGLLTNSVFIPSDEMGSWWGSFKISFQVANTDHPNKAENTVLFSIMEAKDYKANLLLCLQRFKAHIPKFSQVN